MSSLYEMTNDFAELFDRFEEISAMTFDKNEKGEFVDDDGAVITDPEAAKSDMLEAWFDTLDGMEQDIQRKAESVAVYIKNISAEISALKYEEDRLKSRRKAKENAVERMKKYLMDCMTSAKLKKIDMPRAVISVRNNAESVAITDEAEFIKWAEQNGRDDLLKYSAPEIRKSSVKQELKAEENIPFAELVRTQSVIIK